jgi:hypothetical protein
MNWFPTGWRCDAHARWRAGGVPVGRGLADRGAGAAGGSRSPGSSALRSAVARADRGRLGAERAWSWPAIDIDGELRAPDGDQAAHGLGLRNARAGGLRLAAPAALLPDRDRSARCASAGARGPQAQGDAQGQDPTGHRPFAFGRAGCPCYLQDAGQTHGRRQSGGHGPQPAGWTPDRTLSQRGSAARRRCHGIGTQQRGSSNSSPPAANESRSRSTDAQGG